MAWTIPDKGEGAHDTQSILFQEYLDVLVAGLSGVDCVLDGCGITANNNMAPSVAKGSVLSNGTLLPVTAGTVTIGTADATNPRIDLIVVNSSGTKAVRVGTAAASPKPPARSANDVVLGAVYVAANDTSIGSTEVTDMRVLRTVGPILLKKSTTVVTQNTSSAKVAYFTVTIPSGLLATSGRKVRVRLGGNMLANSGTPTFTLTIDYGGTTLFADVTSTGLSADADRRPWFVEFDLSSSASNAQALSGIYSLGTTATLTQATTGQGDIGNLSNLVGAIAGSATVDSDSADRDLVVSWTMSVSNSADEIVMNNATAELL